MANVSHANSERISGAARGVADAVRETGREVRDTVQQMGSTAKDMAEAGLDKAREAASDYLDKGREKAKALEESLEIQIRTRPLSAVLFAAAIGFLVAIFLNRSR